MSIVKRGDKYHETCDYCGKELPPEDIELIKKYKKRAAKKATKSKNSYVVYHIKMEVVK